MNKTVILCVSIVCIAGLEAVALLKGIDGVLLTGVIGSISGMVGFVFGIGKRTSKS